MEVQAAAAAAAAAAAGRVCGFDMVTNRTNNPSNHAESPCKIQVSAKHILAKSKQSRRINVVSKDIQNCNLMPNWGTSEIVKQ